MKWNFIRVLTLLAFVFIDTSALAQDGPSLEYVAFLRDKGKPVDAVTVVLYEGSVKVKDFTTGPNGQFIFYIPFNREYTIVVQKAGYIKETININTAFPEPGKEENMSTDMNIKMYAFPKDGRTIFFDEPVAKVFFQDDIGGFDYDLNYEKTIKTKLDAIEAFVAAKDKVFDDAKKAEAAAIAAADFEKKKTEIDAAKEESIKSQALAKQKEEEERKKTAEANAAEEAQRLAAIESKRKEEESKKLQETERLRQETEMAKVEVEKEKNRLAAEAAKTAAAEEQRKKDVERLKMEEAKKKESAELAALAAKNKEAEEEKMQAEKAAEAAKIAEEERLRKEQEEKAKAEEAKKVAAKAEAEKLRLAEEAAKIKAEEERIQKEKAAEEARKAEAAKSAAAAAEAAKIAKAAEEVRLLEEAKKAADAEAARVALEQKEAEARKAVEAERQKKLEESAKQKQQAEELARLEEQRKAKEERDKAETEQKRIAEENLRLDADSARLTALADARIIAAQDSVYTAQLTEQKRLADIEKVKLEEAKKKEEEARLANQAASTKAAEEARLAAAAKASADEAERKRQEEELRLATQADAAKKAADAANAKALAEQRLSELRAAREKATADSMAVVSEQAEAARLAAEIEKKKKEALIIKYKEQLAQEQNTIVKTTDTKEVDYNNKEQTEKFLSELAKKYAEGITKEVITEPKRTINRFVVVKSGQANEYKEIRYAWGGLYYFKDGQTITAQTFNQETKKQ